MLKFVILGLLACSQVALSIPVGAPSSADSAAEPQNQDDLAVLTEFDRLFNQLHYDIDYKLRIYRMNHSRDLKNLNAQFISRYAFVITDIQHKKQEVKNAILEHALDIGDTQNPCIVEKNDEAIRRATQAARDLSVAAEKIYGEMATIVRIYFYPIVKDFQQTSSEFQWAVLDVLSQDNVVTGLQLALADLAFKYMANANMVDRVVDNLDYELEGFQDIINSLRRGVFKEIDDIGRNYLFNMEQLLTDALECEV
ncbi:uncharacterized protein LOC109402457 [Aedes albopictus]|uniref:Secreted protein n=1 Tax=Aedes albopictus TaxID=7160 RepID=A0ABM1Y5D0_AEDAL|nr:hypothetical protein RP20_CCG000770 [Aedes albopictus]